MALYKAAARAPGNSGFTVRVEYADVAGAYGGWVLVRVQGSQVPEADDNSYAADGPGNQSWIASEGLYGSAYAEPGNIRDRMGRRFVDQVDARLNAMFGVGHAAAWTATIVNTVTPAVINDDWGTP